VQSNIDLTFASGVRALMRQDPDIIMVGEIRDLETAEMAIQAALTGHLVLSTLHTNDAPSAITRLLELGVPHYLLKATLLGVMAQRLVRTLCPHCKAPHSLNEDDWQSLTKPWNAPLPTQACRAVGCLECRDTGYRGRAGVYEIMLINDAMKPLISADTDLIALRAARRGDQPPVLELDVRIAAREAVRALRHDLGVLGLQALQVRGRELLPDERIALLDLQGGLQRGQGLLRTAGGEVAARPVQQVEHGRAADFLRRPRVAFVLAHAVRTGPGLDRGLTGPIRDRQPARPDLPRHAAGDQQHGRNERARPPPQRGLRMRLNQ
jgi:hypothetical protein